METLQSEPVETDLVADLRDRFNREAVSFKAINDRVKRAEGLDASLNHSKEVSVKYINRLLDKFNVISLEAIPVLAENPPADDPETTTGGWLVDGRGVE